MQLSQSRKRQIIALQIGCHHAWTIYSAAVGIAVFLLCGTLSVLLMLLADLVAHLGSTFFDLKKHAIPNSAVIVGYRSRLWRRLVLYRSANS